MPVYCAVVVLGYISLIIDASDVSPYSLGNLISTRQRRQTTGGGCILPEHPDHGQWKVLNGNASPGDKVPASTVIKFDCNPGHKLSIEYHYSVCDDGWDSLRFPECEVLCPPLYSSTTYALKCTDRRGREIKCNEATEGTYVEYTCAPFYETPFGYKKTLLCANGKWNQRPICQPVCGKKITNDTKLLIVGSKPNEKLEYPWTTTLYRKENDTFKYICGGSILSVTVVLTAAHCVTNGYGDTLPKENYLVGAGKLYNKYKAPEDTKAQYLELSKIVVHEDYKANSRRFLADIALLVVNEEFSINEAVQPVCFNNLKSIHLHPGSIGQISGWGLTEDNNISEKLRTLTIPYKYETTCAQELPKEWADKFNLIDKICAGFVNESKGVCEGDSGNGLVFVNPEDNRYYIHGVVSLGPMDQGNCNVQQNFLYTKVAFYYEHVDRLLTIYAPVVKDCKLPPHPQNGKWVIDNQKNEPGDAVSSNTVLRIKCNDGFKLSTLLTEINCASTYNNMPTCQALCPPLQFPNGTDYRCFNEAGQTINCLESVDGTKLVYSCPKGYIIPAGSNTRTCKKGSWGTLQPGCERPNKNCGKKGKSHKELMNQQLPVNGLEYPWNIFLYHKDSDGNFTYICGATLLSNKVVLTTAVCVTGGRDSKIPEENFQLGAGKKYSKYKDRDDVHTQYSNVSHIRIHDSYRGGTRRYAADIAVIVAATPFTFNNYVQPICFNGVDDIQLHQGDLGVVQKFEFTNEQKFLEIPFKNEKVCEREFPKDFADKYNVLDKICAGLGSNETERLCFGDSGKAYAVRNPEDDRFYIYGLVSITHVIQGEPERICHSNTLYTSVPFYYDFVNKALSDYRTDDTSPKDL